MQIHPGVGKEGDNYSFKTDLKNHFLC